MSHICSNEYSASTELSECGQSSSSSCCYCCHWCSWFLFNNFNRIVYSHLEWRCVWVCVFAHLSLRSRLGHSMCTCVYLYLLFWWMPPTKENMICFAVDWWSRLLMLIQCGSHSHTQFRHSHSVVYHQHTKTVKTIHSVYHRNRTYHSLSLSVCLSFSTLHSLDLF